MLGTDYVTQGAPVEVLEYLPPDAARTTESGTRVVLSSLSLKQALSPGPFAKSMARRFSIRQDSDEFLVKVNGLPLPADDALAGVQFSFPSDYRENERPVNLKSDGDWGIETLPEGSVRWRIRFTEDPLADDEVHGVSIFCHGKLAQVPFFFNLSGGLSGQHGQAYMSGRVEADYIDEQVADLIAPERQRINFERDQAKPLESWGQGRVRQLLGIWRDRRGEARRVALEAKVTTFSGRLDALPSTERRTVRAAIERLGGIAALSKDQFEDLGGALLTAWEGGRLKNLIDEFAQSPDAPEDVFISLLAEAEVLTALNLAEAVKTKQAVIEGLRKRIENRHLENLIRDYIAEHPHLIGSRWQTYQRERKVDGILAEAAKDVGFLEDSYKGRVDLALRSDKTLLVVEFMRPGLTLDVDHLIRCERYVDRLRNPILAETQLGISAILGLVVADRVASTNEIENRIRRLDQDGVQICSWDLLLRTVEDENRDYLTILASSAKDGRLQALLPSASAGEN